MALDLQYTLINDTPADAGPPEANFARIEQYVNQETIQRNGTVAMTAQLKLLGDPVEALDAAPKQYVDTFIPVGSILMFGGDAAPPGGKWALCNGAELEVAAYPTLYALYGTKYGGSSGHFNLPNLAGKFPLGVGPTDLIGVSLGSRDAAVVNHAHPIDHTHALATTATDSPDHAHLGVDHLHTGGTVGANVRHAHNINIGTVIRSNPFAPTFNVNVSAAGSGAGTTPADFFDTNVSSGNDSPDHAHAFTTNGADRGLTTGGANARHSHAFQTPAYAGASGNPTGGVAATNANMPPYLVINFIVRIA